MRWMCVQHRFVDPESSSCSRFLYFCQMYPYHQRKKIHGSWEDGTRRGCASCGWILILLVVLNVSLGWGVRFSDDIVTFWVESGHGRSFLVMTRGVEMCVLDDTNT